MIQRWLHSIFGHSPIIRVTEIQARPDAQPKNYMDPQMFNIHKFGATTIAMMCPCGRGAQQVLLGKQQPSELYEKELAELRKMAGL